MIVTDDVKRCGPSCPGCRQVRALAVLNGGAGAVHLGAVHALAGAGVIVERLDPQPRGMPLERTPRAA